MNFSFYRTHYARLIFPAALLCPVVVAYAAVTDISRTPMASFSSSAVKPNIMFIIDDSDSMGRDYLPEAAHGFPTNGYGRNSKHCNGLAYDPATVYKPAVYPNGSSYGNSSFTGAWRNGISGGGTTNLTGSYYYKYTGIELDLGFTYNSTGGVISSSNFYAECISNVGSNPGSSKFDQVIVSATSGPGGTDERVNFANWFSYYRTRLLAMKTAAGRAFKTIDNKYRVGFSTINYPDTSNTSSKFLGIEDFELPQKNDWYSKLYGTTTVPDTPLRSALSKAGQIYAGRAGNDPVQYSCQQNFAILSTDGYWNGAAGYKIDNTPVGNQDGTGTAPPMLDRLNKPDTLSDVAMYYYKTDLRTAALSNCTGALGIDVCENNVLGGGVDTNAQQHMTTFTLGLGVSGTLAYSENYLTGGSADYNAIQLGTKDWPAPKAENPTAIDDLWHAAVNGRGTYFSAQNPDSLVSGLSRALVGITARTGSAAAAATSNLEPVAGDNYVFAAVYRSVNWDGDLQAKTIDPATGIISSTAIWSAQPLLDTEVSASSDTRTIYTFDSAATNGLKLFTWNSLNSGEQANFINMCSPSAKLSQCADLTTTQQTATSGENLVNFIRGQNGYEDQSPNTDRIYRDREHVLGDMISSQPIYVSKPQFDYVDDNYITFRDATQKHRTAMVYMTANDGMLHAFTANNGVEQWAYIPPMVLPNLYKLADKNYAANHQYYVDGSPTVGDICSNAPGSTCSGSQWKTILVGGLNAGGRGYYALDVTNPASPKALWNFTQTSDPDIGYSFGNPIITKRQDGTWIVVFTSGYNNVSPGTGQGYLYVLNANTGVLLEKISTNTGDATTPSGLAKINGWVDSTVSNTTERFYGGDLLGNVWRFDIDNTTPPNGKEATRIAELGNVNGAGIQPVTTKPELTEISAGGVKHVVVNVATGRYLGISDLTDTSQQSVYSFKDKLTSTGLGKVRVPNVLVKQTLNTFSGASGQQLRTSSTNTVDWATQSGWYVDLNPNNESPGERVNVDMQQQLGLLIVTANVPDANACSIGGYAWLYSFDYRTGQYIQTASENMVGRKLGTNALVGGIKTIKLTNGKTVTFATDVKGNITGNDDPTSNLGIGGDVKRMSWRELID